MTARAGAASRDPLGCQFELRHFGLWRSAVAAVAFAALAGLLVWLSSGTTPRATSTMAAAALAAIAVVFFALSLAGAERGTLARSGGRWSFTPQGHRAGEPEAGELTVAIDLGGFLLLCLRRPGRLGRRWLPAQRRGNEAHWHALRCAAHAPRPPAAHVPAGTE